MDYGFATSYSPSSCYRGSPHSKPLTCSEDADTLPLAEGTTPWTPDDAHQPSLAYVPFH
jgi:hypothetical protein